MKVAPINISLQKYKSISHKNSFSKMYIPAFKADRFVGFSVLDSTLSELKNTVDEVFVPYIDEYKDRYSAVGLIGIDLQAIIDEIKEQNNEFFRNEISGSRKSEIFDTVKDEIKEYEQYLNNVRDYQHIVQMGQNSIYNSPEIQQKLSDARSLFESDSVFAEKKQLFNVYKDCIKNLDDNTLNINLKSSEPEVYEKVKLAKDLYYNTIAIIMMLPVNEAIHIKAQTEALLKSEEKGYVRLQKAEKLLSQIYSCSILKCIESSKENEAEINRFLEDTKDYKSKIPSASEIKAAYKNLQVKKDLVFQKAESKLQEYYNTKYLAPDNDDEINKLLNEQRTANEELWSMIEKSRSDYIARRNEDTI